MRGTTARRRSSGQCRGGCRRLLAIQAQDLRGARLAVRARSAGLSASDVDAALSRRRSLIVTWLNRGTLHLVRAEDYWWLHPLTTPQLRTGNSRRLAQEGVPPQDAERAVATVQAALAADGPLIRSQLRERVAAAGVRTDGQAMVHILALASIRGLIVRGPVAGRDQAFVLARDWLGTPPPRMGREAALGELARRYLAGHAPAADRDLAQWAGIGLADARLGLARSGAVQREDGLAQLPANPRRAAGLLPPPRLLGAFEPLLLGWASRDAGQGVIEVEMVQHGHHRDQVSLAVPGRFGELLEAAVADTDPRVLGQPRARGGGHARVGVDPGDASEVRSQLPGEHARPAADVHGGPAAGWQVTQDPAVEVLVVIPRVARVDPVQPSPGPGQHRIRAVPDIHARQSPRRCANPPPPPARAPPRGSGPATGGMPPRADNGQLGTVRKQGRIPARRANIADIAWSAKRGMSLYVIGLVSRSRR